MIRKMLIVLVSLFAFASVTWADGSSVDLLRHEAQFPEGGNSQLNSSWWIHTKGGVHTQLYTFFDTTSGDVLELNATAGPTFKVGRAQVYVPIGVRFHPSDDWKLSHVITKLNGFVSLGDWYVLAINDFSWATDSAPNEHFIEYQLVWHPQGQRFGAGMQTDAFYLGSTEANWTVGPLLRVKYLTDVTDERVWDGTLELYPFYSVTHGTCGLKVNLLNFRFGKEG